MKFKSSLFAFKPYLGFPYVFIEKLHFAISSDSDIIVTHHFVK